VAKLADDEVGMADDETAVFAYYNGGCAFKQDGRD